LHQYKLAIRNAARTVDIEFDDEISQLYQNSGKKWISRFSKRNSVPTVINDRSEDCDIAAEFSKSFSNVYFDSYADEKLFGMMHEGSLKSYCMMQFRPRE